MKQKNPFKKLMDNVRLSARSASEKGQRFGRCEALEVNIDAEYLEYIFNKQNGCCPYYKKIGVIRKINMNLIYVTFTSLAPSVDRIDSTKGYIKGNVVITFRGINQLKQRNTLESFLKELKYLTFGDNTEINNSNTNMKANDNGSVKVRGTVNTVDFERVMNQFTSSFTKSVVENLTESFLKVVESQFGMGIQSKRIEEVSVEPKVVKPKNTSLKSKYDKAGERASRNARIRNENLKPYTPNKVLTPASVVFGVEKASSLVNRGEDFWNELVKSGSLYMNKNGSVTDFLVDEKRIPQSLRK
jgi:hypothetical protein